MKPPRTYVVALKNQFTATGYEYFNLTANEESLVGFHNPHSAKSFNKVSEAKLFIRESITFKDVEVLPLEAEAEKFQNWLSEGCTYRTLPAKNKLLSRKYNGESRTEVLKWWVEQTKSHDFEVDYEDYKTWPDLFSKFSHIHSVEGFEDGTITFSLYTPQNGKFKTFKKEFDLVRPYCTCIDVVDGRKIYHVFDHYLCSGGNSVSLVEYKNGSFSVNSNYNTIELAGSIEDCFEYLRRHRWYE